MSLTEAIKVWAEGVIQAGGYPGIGALTFLGCCNVPIPSEAVLPFGGIMAQKGVLNVHGVAWIGTIGCVVGSVVSYGIGATFGTQRLEKYGKYLFISKNELDHGEKFFSRYGLLFTFWGRLIPVVRSFVSLPAGIYRANFLRFVAYAIAGSLPWCYLWAYIGFALGENWKKLEPYMKVMDVIVVGVILALVFKLLWHRLQPKKAFAEDQSIS